MNDNPQRDSTSTFGGYHFSDSLKSLINNNGEEVRLRAKSLAVFKFLADRADTVVSKEDILQSVWTDRFASEESLTKSISEIRQALNDQQHQTLRTLPRQGYMLVSDPAQLQQASTTYPARRQLLVMLAIVLLLFLAAFYFLKDNPETSTSKNPAIIVNQFQDLTGESRWMRLASGLSSELVAELAQNSWLRIIQTNKNEIVSEELLNVIEPGFVLSGTLQAENESLRISAQLKQHSNNEVVWSQRWQEPASDLFSIQDQIIEKVYSTLSGEWSGVVARHGIARAGNKPTESLDAFELYLLGVEYKHKFTATDNRQSIDYLEKAVGTDPRFGKAWSTLSIAYMNQRVYAASKQELNELTNKQKSAISTAYELIPDHPEVLIGYSYLTNLEGDNFETDRLLQRAVETGWNNPDVLAYATWAGSGRASESIDPAIWGRRAIEIHPQHPDWYRTALAATYYKTNRPQQAIDTLKNATGGFDQLLYRAGAYGLLGDTDNATTVGHEARELSPSYSIDHELQNDPINSQDKRQTFIEGLRAAGFK